MKRLFFLLSIFLLISCGNSSNSEEFMSATEGRYLFNANETIQVSYVEGVMNIRWRDQDMIPVKLNDSSFYLKKMNEKLVFHSKPEMRIVLAEKREHEGEKFVFVKLGSDEKTPKEYFDNKEYDKALNAYLAIQKKDSLDSAIQWYRINDAAHDLLRSDNKEEAFEMFKINIALYPDLPRSYRNYGYALIESKDTVGAIKNYRKALSINPNDNRALAFFERIERKIDE